MLNLVLVDGTFNVREIIEGVRLFVFNFFSCRECAENFKKETEDYLRYLSKPYDAIQYLWKSKISDQF